MFSLFPQAGNAERRGPLPGRGPPLRSRLEGLGAVSIEDGANVAHPGVRILRRVVYGQRRSAGSVPCRAHRQRDWARKNHTISADASGPRGSVKEPTAWEAALHRVQACRSRLVAMDTPDPAVPVPDFAGLATDLAAAWSATGVTTRSRQHLIRTLVSGIIADVDDVSARFTRRVLVPER